MGECKAKLIQTNLGKFRHNQYLFVYTFILKNKKKGFNKPYLKINKQTIYVLTIIAKSNKN